MIAHDRKPEPSVIVHEGVRYVVGHRDEIIAVLAEIERVPMAAWSERWIHGCAELGCMMICLGGLPCRCCAADTPSPNAEYSHTPVRTFHAFYERASAVRPAPRAVEPLAQPKPGASCGFFRGPGLTADERCGTCGVAWPRHSHGVRSSGPLVSRVTKGAVNA